MKDLLLIIASVVTVLAIVPYIRDILRHKTKPNLVSWITWTLITGIATAAEINSHEYRTAIFTAAAMLGTSLVVIFGLRHGFVKYTRFDVICQISSIVGIILWQLFNTPLIAVVASVAIDLVGVLPTLRHSWRKPFEETWQAFAISGVGAAIAIGAFTAYNWTSLTYAIYILGINFIVSLIILYRRAGLSAYSK